MGKSKPELYVKQAVLERNRVQFGTWRYQQNKYGVSLALCFVVFKVILGSFGALAISPHMLLPSPTRILFQPNLI